VSLSILLLALACMSQAADPPPDSHMKVIYHPKARRPYKPDEPIWSGEPPCSRFPTAGQGPLRLTGDSSVTPPQLRSRKKADYSHLTSKTRLFAPFVAECTISAEGRVSEVRVLRYVSDEFDRLVLSELESSLYTPAAFKEAPIPVCLTYTARPHP